MPSRQALQDRFQRHIAFCFRLRLADAADTTAAVFRAAADAGACVKDLALVELAEGSGEMVYDLTVFTTGDAQMAEVRSALESIPGVAIDVVTDLAMDSHIGGACEMRSRRPIRSNTDLRIVYTPGVARVCKAIEAEPDLARTYTNIANKVAICTNGTAILGLGDIGCVPGLPVMEGKSAIFWEFAGISAEPILVDTHDADAFIDVMMKIAPTFGAIQVEDVKAPECFTITRELDEHLPIPVFHDDQHGTATVVLAGLYSALARTGKRIEDQTCVISGAGAAGTAIADLLARAGVPDVVLCDSRGVLHKDRTENMNPETRAPAERRTAEGTTRTLAHAMGAPPRCLAPSQPDIVTQEMVRSMQPDPIVFALANPVSEIAVPDAYAAGASVVADGRMMNNALAYPGLFRGALDAQSPAITIEMMMAAAEALSKVVPEGELMPEMMDPATHQAVARAVAEQALLS